MEFKGTKGKWEVYNPNHIGCINVSFGKNDGISLFFIVAFVSII